MNFKEFNSKTRYKVIMTHEDIGRFIHHCEDTDDATFMEFEQIFKNAKKTKERETMPLEREDDDL